MTELPPRDAIVFRPTIPADAPFLRYLYGTTREEELRPLPWSDDQKAQFLDMQFQAQTAHYADHYADAAFQVIELRGKPIGRLILNRTAEEIEIIDIGLLPEYRGRGIGGVLLDEILAEAKSSSRRVLIYVENYNPARRLYDRLGFRHIETNGVYHLMQWRA